MIDIFLGAVTLLMLGGLAMTGVPPRYQTFEVWLLLSLAGIPLFLVIIMIPELAIGGLIMLAFFAGGGGRR
ncbi:hypothetical protein [Kushneria aurantia]|uniref:Uncharacterized protein n=1 Tax=Kushneria aurantia TaxID=504092 RepID=A0ABV6G4K0_9GAMM|nr:hypothetical protein [Kushneria aurantia]